MKELPRITLISPSFQQVGYLAECLDSVRDQAYPDLEHLVVDGGSSDGSKELIAARSSDFAW
ncbi:MAG: glycosyltransferase, partial [Flavobacteriales bacterium]|nr:glycosyltransferase [Flavobacteriales bacterium]